MTTDNFDYKSFASDMTNQAKNLLPSDISNEDREYIQKTMYDFISLSGEAVCNDDRYDFSVDEAKFICQVIAEWIFHKGVDLAHSAVPKEYWDCIMQKIAFVIFEVAKQGIKRSIEQTELVVIIENHVNKTWKNCLEELSEKNVIPNSVTENAKNLSNIDDMAKKADENERIAKLEKIYNSEDAEKKLNKSKHLVDFSVIAQKASNFITSIKVILNELLHICGIAAIIVCCLYLFDKFNILTSIIQYKNLLYLFLSTIAVVISAFVRYNQTKNFIKKEFQRLEKIRQKLKFPKSICDRLGANTITLTIGKGLLPIKHGNLLEHTLENMRHDLVDELGYIVPEIKIIDSDDLEDNEYTISIRENLVGTGCVYPGRYMVIADQWDSMFEHIPDDAIVGIDPVYATQAYWISRNDAKLNKKLTAVDACDVIQTHLKEELIKHVEDVISLDEVKKLINFANKKAPEYYKDIKKNGLTDYDLKKIFAKLIREKVSVKDIVYVFEKLCEYSKFSNDYIVLSERLRAAFGRQICLKNVEEDHVLYAVTLSQDWENTLDESVQKTELGIMFLIEPDTVHNLTETTAMTLMIAHQNIGHQPVILCSPRIRLPLFELLVRHIPTIVVISYSELIPDIKVKNTYKVGEELPDWENLGRYNGYTDAEE